MNQSQPVSLKSLYATRDLLWDHLIPNMRLLFMLTAPEKYVQWQGNCCRQAAVLSAIALRDHLGLNPANNRIALIERKMSAMVAVGGTLPGSCRWDHAFLNIQRYKRKKILSIDMSLKQDRPIFHTWRYASIYQYPHKLNEYIVSYFSADLALDKSHDPFRYEHEPEYYTGLTIRQIYDFCLNASQLNQETLDELRKPDHFRAVAR